MEENKLYILWTNASVLTFKKMISMYAFNGKKNNWWDNVTVIIWGETAQLVDENEEVQIHINKLIEIGVNVSACKACADELGVSDKFQELGIELKYWGTPLTKLIKSKENLITI